MSEVKPRAKLLSFTWPHSKHCVSAMFLFAGTIGFSAGCGKENPVQAAPPIVEVGRCETRMRRVGVAIANFFPQIGRTALLGQASTPLSQITAGSANVWSIAANLAGPIYTGGALTAQKHQAIAAWEQTKLQ
jgi:hypothetical protein